MRHLLLALAFAALSCTTSAATDAHSFEGVVRENPAYSKPHFQRMSRWYLETADGNWDLYTKDDLAQYTGKRVRVTGETEESEIEGQHHREIHPAKIERID